MASMSGSPKEGDTGQPLLTADTQHTEDAAPGPQERSGRKPDSLPGVSARDTDCVLLVVSAHTQGRDRQQSRRHNFSYPRIQGQ